MFFRKLILSLILAVLVMLLCIVFVWIGRSLAPDTNRRIDEVRMQLDRNTQDIKETLSQRLDVLDRKLDILLNIATNVPPDFTHR